MVFTGFDIINNKFEVDFIGISLTNVVTATSTVVEDNCIDLTTRFNTTVTQPTIGILLNTISGTNPFTLLDNIVTDGHYGYVLHNVNTSSAKQKVEGGFITGVLQGVAVVNTLDGINLFPSEAAIDGVNMSLFSGTIPSVPAIDFPRWDIYLYCRCDKQ